MRRHDPAGDLLEFGLGLSECDPIPEPGNHPEVPAAAAGPALRELVTQRRPDLGRGCEQALEARWQHADHLIAGAPDAQRPAEDPGIPTESPLPDVMAEDHDPGS